MRALVRSMKGGHPARPAVIFSNNADAAGIAWAEEHEIPTEVVDHRPFGEERARYEGAIAEALSKHEPDLICLAGFMRVLTARFVNAWDGRMLNIHPSLLPKYRGLNTHARAIADGENEHGCTVHLVTPELDEGPILGQAKIAVLPSDTPQSLAARVLKQEHMLYPAVLERFANGETDPLFIS